jgi:hypothetical protein
MNVRRKRHFKRCLMHLYFVMSGNTFCFFFSLYIIVIELETEGLNAKASCLKFLLLIN